MLKVIVEVPVEAENAALHALRAAPQIIGRCGPTVTRLEAAVMGQAFEQTIGELVAIEGAEIIEADVIEDLAAEVA